MKISLSSISDKQMKVIQVSALAGSLAGLALAHKQGKGFWGYVGYWLLGSIVGSAVIGYPVSKIIDDDKK